LKAFITGSGMYVPEHIVTNEELAPKLGVTVERIHQATGVTRRRWAAPGTHTSMLAAHALKDAIHNAGLSAHEIDFLLLGTTTPDRFIPGTAPAVQKHAGLGLIPCLDIRATCVNALYALQVARSLIVAGNATHVGACFAEIQSPWLDLSPASANISMLFADGAGAFIVSKAPREGALQVLDILLRTDGQYADKLGVRAPGTEYGPKPHAHTHERDFHPRMDGPAVLLRASRSMVAACRAVLNRNGLTAQEVRWVVPHQANINILHQVMRGLGISRHPERLVAVIEDYGNTSSASQTMALDALLRSGQLTKGDYVLMPAFGAGFTWGTALCRAV
jgi:3-oxoacyl-[acyl-carrier-protein] synthase-3